ncbi:TPA: DUF1251 domain-containing protein [Klebsiella pneumoniae]|nr:DUF1251 domain-containing protein [Klebsiella pneumoniae]TYF69715.1 hypothetical protein DJ544_07265 [Enterobacter roggenkampii]HAS1516936.1 DUF1251 domain-containing protein [Enterobacter hormaechei]HBY1088610.1 DUF1251 domain-containing protein [Klebsiella pneumoniae]
MKQKKEKSIVIINKNYELSFDGFINLIDSSSTSFS